MVTQSLAMVSLTAADLMSRDMTLIPRNMSLRTAARLLAERSVSGAPVVDEAGHCIGVLSTADFMRAVKNNHRPFAYDDSFCFPWQIDEKSEKLLVAEVVDYMTSDPVTAAPTATIGDLAGRMIDAHIHRVIVVDEEQRPIGVVSSMDVLAAVARSARN